MKKNWLLIGLATAGLGFTFIANSQEPAPPAFEKAARRTTEEPAAPDLFDEDADAPKLIRVHVELIELPHEALTKLLFLSKPKESDATELRKQLQEMVSKNEAKMLETQMITAKSGQKATTEAIHEFIYPTEYEQPSLPGTFDGTEKNSSHSPTIALPPIPTAFETRNLGSTLEVEPTLGENNKTIDLRLVPEIMWHTGNTVWHDGKDLNGNPFKVTTPDIYTMRLNTSLTCINGQYSLAGVVSPKDDKGEVDMTRKVMVFVKCDVLTVK